MDTELALKAIEMYNVIHQLMDDIETGMEIPEGLDIEQMLDIESKASRVIQKELHVN